MSCIHRLALGAIVVLMSLGVARAYEYRFTVHIHNPPEYTPLYGSYQPAIFGVLYAGYVPFVNFGPAGNFGLSSGGGIGNNGGSPFGGSYYDIFYPGSSTVEDLLNPIPPFELILGLTAGPGADPYDASDDELVLGVSPGFAAYATGQDFPDLFADDGITEPDLVTDILDVYACAYLLNTCSGTPSNLLQIEQWIGDNALTSIGGSTPAFALPGQFIFLKFSDGTVIGDGSDLMVSTPEPASWAMLLTGLAGLGATIRMTRRKAASRLASVSCHGLEVGPCQIRPVV